MYGNKESPSFSGLPTFVPSPSICLSRRCFLSSPCARQALSCKSLAWNLGARSSAGHASSWEGGEHEVPQRCLRGWGV